MLITEPDKIMEIAKNARNVAVVGISKNKERASYQIAEQIKDKYNLFLVNPKYAGEEILGKKVFSSLKEIKEKIDIVDVFRNPKYIEEIIKDAIEIKADTIWLQPGSENMEVIEKYKDQIDIIYNSCLGVVSKQI
ncbi:MAG: CoA-binding protein [Thermoplasmata archaeon]|nr:MAG: CoA-binding protein [Thermoplasmata archaeon]HDN95897.1 CoA-binding protein [Thermoplasmatales archaeon]